MKFLFFRLKKACKIGSKAVFTCFLSFSLTAAAEKVGWGAAEKVYWGAAEEDGQLFLEELPHLELIKEITKYYHLPLPQSRIFFRLFSGDYLIKEPWDEEMETNLIVFSAESAEIGDHEITFLSPVKDKGEWQEALIISAKIQTAYNGIYYNYENCVNQKISDSFPKNYIYSFVEDQVRTCYPHLKENYLLESDSHFSWSPEGALVKLFELCDVEEIVYNGKILLPWDDVKIDALTRIKECGAKLQAEAEALWQRENNYTDKIKEELRNKGYLRAESTED